MKNEPVFPETHINCHGLTKLEWYSGLAMQGIMTNSYIMKGVMAEDTANKIPEMAVELAKKLIEQLRAEKCFCEFPVS